MTRDAYCFLIKIVAYFGWFASSFWWTGKFIWIALPWNWLDYVLSGQIRNCSQEAAAMTKRQSRKGMIQMNATFYAISDNSVLPSFSHSLSIFTLTQRKYFFLYSLSWLHISTSHLQYDKAICMTVRYEYGK